MNAVFQPRGALHFGKVNTIVGVSHVEGYDVSISLRPDDGDTKAAFIHLGRSEALELAKFLVRAARPTAGELLAI